MGSENWFEGPVSADSSMTSMEACQAICAATTGCDFFVYIWTQTSDDFWMYMFPDGYKECLLKEGYGDDCDLPVEDQYVPVDEQYMPSSWQGTIVSGPASCSGDATDVDANPGMGGSSVNVNAAS